MTLSFHSAGFGAASLATLVFLRDAIEQHRPDVVVADNVVFAGPLARARRIPVVQVTMSPYFPGSGVWVEKDHPAFRCPPALPAVTGLFEQAGAPAPDHLDELIEGDVFLSPTPADLGTTPRALHYEAGSDLPGRAGALPKPRDPARPRVGLALGGWREALEAAIEAVTSTGAEPVVLDDRTMRDCGPLLAALGLEPAGRVDMDAVMPGLDAVVHHGGAGTTTDALRGGTPAVVVPSQTEQDLNARYVERAGAGRRVPVAPGDPEPADLGHGITGLVHRRPVDLARRMAEALSELLERGRPTAPWPVAEMRLEDAADLMEAAGTGVRPGAGSPA
jgi:UDP:flavonoid glycosyltransferase YjiC (YdhE family)